MGRGILGDIIAEERLPNGKLLITRNADKVAGVTCEIHHLRDNLGGPELLAMIKRPGGVDACKDCLEALLEARRQGRAGR